MVTHGGHDFDSWSGEQSKGKVSRKASETQLEMSFGDRYFEDGWVALDMKLDHIYFKDVLFIASRDAFRLKIDDAHKLSEYGRANKLDVSMDATIVRAMRRAGLKARE